MRTLNASEFKARCLKILDDVAATGDSVTILKRGRPVALLGPAVPTQKRHPQHDLAGSVQTRGDIVAPALPAERWGSTRRKRR